MCMIHPIPFHPLSVFMCVITRQQRVSHPTVLFSRWAYTGLSNFQETVSFFECDALQSMHLFVAILTGEARTQTVACPWRQMINNSLKGPNHTGVTSIDYRISTPSHRQARQKSNRYPISSKVKGIDGYWTITVSFVRPSQSK